MKKEILIEIMKSDEELGLYNEPKHKSKVLTKEEVMEGRSNAYEFLDFDKEEQIQENHYDRNFISYSIVREKKQETLEEVAEIFVKNRFTKQICNDESYPDIYASKEAIVESHILFAKWQQERSYSEEEVKQIIEAILIEYSDYVLADVLHYFEQFKKK